MIILALDTAAHLCAASVHDSENGELGRSVLDLGKGHAEHLIGVIDEALMDAAKSYDDLDAIAVAVGPGSFTGIRVGVALARGLALALSVPAIGVNTLEALAAEARDAYPGTPVIAALDAGRGQFYVLSHDHKGRAIRPAAAHDWEDKLPFVFSTDLVLTGSAAPKLLQITGGGVLHSDAATADIASFARLASKRYKAGGPIDKPAPLYLRAADAKPQTGFALPRQSPPS